MATKTNEEIDKELERQKAEREKEIADNKAALEEQRNLAKVAGEKAAKAEGMVEALKVFQQTQATNGGKKEWTDEEWDAFKEKTGISREAIVAIDGAVSAKLADTENRFEARAKQAEERAKLAEDKYTEFEKTRSYDSSKNRYLAKRPQFAKYEKEIDEFIADYPAETRKDPVKLEALFNKAEIYIRGKVGDKGMRQEHGGSSRFGSDSHDGEGFEENKTDLSDLRPHERLTVEKILPTKERDEQLKANKHDLKGDMGVMINTREEFDKYKK